MAFSVSRRTPRTKIDRCSVRYDTDYFSEAPAASMRDTYKYPIKLYAGFHSVSKISREISGKISKNKLKGISPSAVVEERTLPLFFFSSLLSPKNGLRRFSSGTLGARAAIRIGVAEPTLLPNGLPVCKRSCRYPSPAQHTTVMRLSNHYPLFNTLRSSNARTFFSPHFHLCILQYYSNSSSYKSQ